MQRLRITLAVHQRLAVTAEQEGPTAAMPVHQSGEVAAITPKGDPVARSFRVRIRLADPARLRVGMTVDANLIVTERKAALLVPSSAIVNGKLWVLADGRLHRQAVRTGVAGAVRTEVLDGLAPQAQIVAVPTDSLREGAAARAKKADEGDKKADGAEMNANE